MRSPESTIDELAMVVRMLISALKRYDDDHPVAAQATRLLADRGLLRRNGLRDYVQIDRETLAYSADQVAARLAAADMVPLQPPFDGGAVIALDAGPGRGWVAPRWQFEPLMQAVLGPIAEALDTTTGWALLSFLETPLGALNGITPRQAIEQGRADQVLQLARSDGDGS